MRVVVATDTIGALSSARAGVQIASAWAAGPSEAAVVLVPVGESAGGFIQALADQLDGDLGLADTGDVLTLSVVSPTTATERVVAVGLDHGSAPPRDVEEPDLGTAAPGIDYHASSLPLGVALRAAIEQGPVPPDVCVVDLGALHSHDGGAGFLAGLGARADVSLTAGVAGLAGLSAVDLEPVRRLLGDAELVGIVPADQIGRPLLGLRGVTSLLGRAPHGSGGRSDDAARLLATDATLEQLARLTNPEAAAVPGAGAAGGAAFAVAALGGVLRTGTGWLADRVDLAGSIGRADLVVTGCSTVDFATRGGGAVAAIAGMAADAMRPCIVIAQEVLIGSRELRAMGVESAYGVRDGIPGRPGPDVPPEDLAALARRVARTWSW